MATNTPALPDHDTAFQTLYADIDNRVFFNKLAAAGYVPQTQGQAQAYLDMGAQLDAVADLPAVKQAADADDPVLRAKAALDRFLGSSQLADPRAVADAERVSILKVAADLARDPAIYNAVLVLKAAEAGEYAAQHGN